MNQTAVKISMPVFEDQYSTEFKLCFGLVSLILSFFIIFLYWGIIYYEKFGHDPLKRDLSNMLFSSFCKSMSIIMPILLVLNTIRIIFGPILLSISVFCYSLALSFNFYWHFVHYEIIIYKFMTLCTKANIVNINDAIWHSILNRINLMCAALLSPITVLMTETPIMVHFWSGTLNSTTEMNLVVPIYTL